MASVSDTEFCMLSHRSSDRMNEIDQEVVRGNSQAKISFSRQYQ